MTKEVMNTIKLWRFYEKLQDDISIKELIKNIPDISHILKEFAEDMEDVFDIEITVFDENSKQDLMTIPSKKKRYIRFKIEQTYISAKTLKKVLLDQCKISEVLIRNSTLKISPYSFDIIGKDQAEHSWEILKQHVEYNVLNFKTPQEMVKVKKTLEKEHVLWCYNSSCTGKTWFGINILDKIKGEKFAYNSSSNQLISIDFLKILLEYGTECCILIDDMQLDRENSLEFIKYLYHHKKSLAYRNMYVFMISWPLFHNLPIMKTYIGKDGISCIKLNPDKYINLLKNQVRNINMDLANICGNNLSLLNKAVSLKTKVISSYQEALINCFISTKDFEQLELVYICAVLGIYEFETPIIFLEQFGHLDPKVLKSGKVANNTIFVAHREICLFISNYLRENYSELKSPKYIMMDYIRFLDGTLKWKALMQIIPENKKHKKSEVFSLGFIWNLLNDLMSSLRKAASLDPSFANTPSSMCFVLLIADYFKEVDDFAEVAKALSDCFIIDGEHIGVYYDSVKTREDFQSIKRNMCEEDQSNPDIPCLYISGSELDEKRMHKIWLLSLLVQVGSVLKHFGYIKLVEYAEKDLLAEQLEDGSWYPNRVPWVTACALRGLAKCGYSKDDLFVKRAIAYIISMINEEGYWEAHTGGWNGIYETSSMCLDALNKCGINCTEESLLNKGLLFLDNHSEDWMNEGEEIDGAATACLLMDTLGVEDKLLDYIKQLTHRNISALFSIAPSDKLTTESCKAALIAYYVTDLCWSILERDLDDLMEEFLEEATGIESDFNNSQESQGMIMNVNVYGGTNLFSEKEAKQIIINQMGGGDYNGNS